MSETNYEDSSIEEASYYIENACVYVAEDLLDSDNVIDDLEFYFRRNRKFVFLDDLRRFSAEHSEFDKFADQNATFIGLGIGSIIAAEAGAEIRFLRYRMEQLTNDDDISDRVKRYDRLGSNIFLEPIKLQIPSFFENLRPKFDYTHGVLAVLECGLEVLTDEGLCAEARYVRESIKRDFKQQDEDRILTIADIDFLN